MNTVREPSSNAFLHIRFFIGTEWIDADDLRRRKWSQPDEAEELALETALPKIRRHPRGKALDDVAATMFAAKWVEKNPSKIEDARKQIAERSEPDAAMDTIMDTRDMPVGPVGFAVS